MIDPRQSNFESTPVSRERARFSYAPVDRGAEPVVTVVTPFYNTGAVFDDTAASVLGQSLQRLEWIIVNDGSKDPAALKLLDKYRAAATRDPRIRIIDRRTNHGLPAARNTGFHSARAEYVFLLDSDDLIEPTTLEKCALHLAFNPGSAFVKGFTVGFEGQQYLWSKGFHDREAFLTENRCTATAMIRRSVHEAVGGFDETVRGGMEDWDFWLRCAAAGYWGETIPEYFDWYRRRSQAAATPWENLSGQSGARAVLRKVRAANPGLFEPGGFPRVTAAPGRPYADFREQPPFANALTKDRPRLMMIVPWLRMGGADRFNLDLLDFLTRYAEPRWEVTIAAALDGHPWLPEFTRQTPDVFMLGHLGPQSAYPAMLRGLIESRRPDVVMVTNSEQGYALLPWLRSVCPGPAYVDFNHMEELYWKSGGHPRNGAAMSSQLDLNIVVSEHLKNWMCEAAAPGGSGAERDRVEVCYINANTEAWRPDAAARGAVRAELGIAADTPVILYAARLCWQKNPQLFARSIDALKGLLSGRDDGADDADGEPRPPAFVALVAGDGEEQKALERELEERGLWDFVKMLGPVEAKRMPSIMAASDIFFLPSRWEGIAMSIYEAMASGLAIVGAAVGGQAELVTPETGILLARPTNERGEEDPETEAAAYAKVLAELLADGPRRAAMGAAARARICDHFELANMGRRMLEVFERAIGLSKESPRQAVPRSLAREMGLIGLECLRVQDEMARFAPYYWRAMEAQQRAEAEAREAEQRDALARIENSRAWRTVNLIKRTPPYRAMARVRFGPGWNMVDAHEPPAARLERIHKSRSYRMIQSMKKVPPYPLYARIMYGGHRGDRC